MGPLRGFLRVPSKRASLRAPLKGSSKGLEGFLERVPLRP